MATRSPSIEPWERLTAPNATPRLRSCLNFSGAYLQLAHDSRADFFEKSFAALDGALEAKEIGVVSEILGSITEVAKKSPFADLKDVGDVKKLWADRDGEIEV